MRVAIIALILSIAALGLGSFATFTSLDNEEATPVPESRWSEAECAAAEGMLWGSEGSAGPILRACFRGDCAEFNGLLQAVNDNCP